MDDRGIPQRIDQVAAEEHAPPVRTARARSWAVPPRAARPRAVASTGPDQLQDTALAAVVHDLKTPLTGISGHAQLARRKLACLPPALAGSVAAHLAAIEAAVTHLAGVIDALGEVGGIQTGADLDLDPRPTDLVALVGGVVTQAQGLTPHAIHLDAAVPALPATVDAACLERVVANLLANAVKYSPGGGDITVAVRREDGAAGPQAVIAVHDRGLGIPAADLPHIFQRFRRGSNVRDRIAGSGIGLASVRQIVDWHGGTVAVESEEGVGSTFSVCLPLADAPGRTAGE